MVRVATKGEKLSFQVQASRRHLANPHCTLPPRARSPNHWGWICREVAVRIESVIRRKSTGKTGRSEPAARGAPALADRGGTERAAGRRHPPAPSSRPPPLRPSAPLPPNFFSKARRVWGWGGKGRGGPRSLRDLRPRHPGFLPRAGEARRRRPPPFPTPPPPAASSQGDPELRMLCGRWRKDLCCVSYQVMSRAGALAGFCPCSSGQIYISCKIPPRLTAPAHSTLNSCRLSLIRSKVAELKFE